MKLAKNLERLGTESAFSILAEAKALEAKGNPMIHLGLGQPDFKTPKHVVEAAKKALAAGATACSFGKMFLFALSAGGQLGVERLLQNMHDEINRNIVLMGCKSLKELNSSKLIYRK